MSFPNLVITKSTLGKFGVSILVLVDVFPEPEQHLWLLFLIMGVSILVLVDVFPELGEVKGFAKTIEKFQSLF